MTIALKGRSLLSLEDMSPEEIRYLLTLAVELRAEKRAGTEKRRLTGKSIALIFEKDSTRTRTSFEVAAYDQGAHVTYLGPTGSQLGKKESVKDTARVLGRIYDAIEFRGTQQHHVEILAQFSGKPVYNGLTDEAHPTQVLADFMTIQAHTSAQPHETALVFMGDTHNNVARSLAVGAMKLGADMRLCGPKSLWPDTATLERWRGIGLETGGRLMVSDDINVAVKGADFVYTDVWLSMGEPTEQWAERIKLLSPYRVTSELMRTTGRPNAKFLHCLPAFHNLETGVGAEIGKQFGIDCMEVTDEVFESGASIVFDQSENRMHTIKALLIATLGG